MTQQLNLPVNVIRHGADSPPPERYALRAGPLSAVLEGAFLRYITFDGHEVVRGVYAAVRDRNWGTPQPRFTRYEVHREVDSFTVRFTAEHVDPSMAIDFSWDGTIEGVPDGTITFTLDGIARSTFLRNRIGFCVLHPADLAGTPITVETTSGAMVSGSFPREISPHQPFLDVAAFHQPLAGGAELEIRFTGDIFETEDQRNWTDASFKTYCTPLGLPYPVEIAAGTRVQQSVTLRLHRVSGRAAANRSGASASPAPLTIRVSESATGTLPPIGFGAATDAPPGERGIDALRRLRPAHLRVAVDLGQDDWRTMLAHGTGAAHALGAALELELVAGSRNNRERLARVAQALRESEVPVARALVFPDTGVVSMAPALAQTRAAFAEAGVGCPIGGGTRADFVTLNRATPPLDAMDVVSYAICPQVHTFDNASMVETLATQGTTVENARRIAQGRPVVVGPITLKQRLNPAATGTTLAPTTGELPPGVDPRQMSLFAAAWTVGSIRHLAQAGAAALTYFQTTGKLGLMEPAEANGRQGWQPHPRFASWPGMLFPVYYVFAAIAALLPTGRPAAAPVQLLAVEASDPLRAEALALRAGARWLLLVANVTGERQSVDVTLPRFARSSGAAAIGDVPAVTVRLLDETTAPAAMRDLDALDAAARPLEADAQGRMTLALLPYAVALISGGEG